MLFKGLVNLLLTATAAAQSIKGFNYGATTESGACQDQGSFTNLFNRANSLPGASGFTSARLYTTIQCGTTNTPTSAIQAAIDTGTNLLLGMWASAGSAAFNNEIAALMSAMNQYPNLANNVIGISVGSEDLYRSSPQGVANNAGVGADAATIIGYISQVRQAISGTSLASKPIGHVDTWTAWVLPENVGVTQAVDWLGHNSFPYFETTHANGIDQGAADFNSALAATESVAGGKPVWVTETGWPNSGPLSGQAVASVANAETYWKAVGCSLFGNRNTWWYTLEDANTAQTDVSFGITPSGSNTPIFDLSCSGASVSSVQSSSQPSSQPSSQSSTQPSTQSTAQSSTESSTESLTESLTESSTESSTTKSSTLVAKSTVSSSTKSTPTTSSASNQVSSTNSEQASSSNPSNTGVSSNNGLSSSTTGPSTIISIIGATTSTSITSVSTPNTISSSAPTTSPAAVGTPITIVIALAISIGILAFL